MTATPRRLMIVGVATLLVGLLAFFPARVAYHWFAPSTLQLAGIDGTVWRGSAKEGQAAGLYIRNLHWTFKPLSLLTGKLAFKTRLDSAGGFINTDLYAALDGSILFENLDVALSVGALRDLIQTAGLDGRISLHFTALEIRDGLPVTANGVAEVTNLFIRGLATTTIGDFRAKFSTTSDGILASVEDTAGMFDLAGTLRVSPDGAYYLSGLIAPTPTTPPAVIEQLRFLGSPNERGQREFRFEGQLQ